MKTIVSVLVALICGLGFIAPNASAADATMTWTAPTTRTDGSPLTNLAGFRIKYGTVAGSYPTVVQVPGAAVTTYTVTGLTGGVTYYFVMTAYDAAGLESSNTSQVSKAIPVSPPNPPTNLVIAQVNGVNVAVAFKVSDTGSRLLTMQGFVPVGKPCLGDPVFTYRSQSYRRVARADVLWDVSPHDNAAAPCAGG